MCGIAGVINLRSKPLKATRLKGMVDVINHRGPDDAGYLVWQSGASHSRGINFGQAFADDSFKEQAPYLPPIDSIESKKILADNPWNLFLGHRRLSILDLSPSGHQPMSDHAGKIWLVYNGEVYNFKELRTELEKKGHRFVSRSDTEVLIHAYEEWGIDCVKRLNGMFAFALFDSARNMLYLARDRYGIKPLYYLETDDGLIFGSEIKTILKYLDSTPEVDLLAMNEYFSFQNIFSDRTLFSGIKLLAPATILKVDIDSKQTKQIQYWDFDFTSAVSMSKDDVAEKLHFLTCQAVKRQCVSDVPIGTYLSGGLDSGTIASLTRRQLGRITSFTAGFDLSEAAEHEQSFDERQEAEKIASLIQSEHYECVLHSGDMEAVMDQLIYHLEDLRVGQCYPNFYVSRLAGKFVKVVMSGIGGDELFAGYPWRYAAAVGDGHEGYVQNYYNYWQRLVSNADKQQLYSQDTIARLAQMDDDGAIPFKDHTVKAFGRVFPAGFSAHTIEEQINSSLYFECKTFLPGILMVEDKLSMAHSLETRVPLLDNDLVDFACQIPLSYKLKGLEHLQRIDENLPRKKKYYHEQVNSGKMVLRKAFSKVLPPEIVHARKQGFSAPDESWFRGTGEEYIRYCFSGRDAGIYEFIDRDFVQNILTEHCSGKVNKRLFIWSLLCFEKWLVAFDMNTI